MSDASSLTPKKIVQELDGHIVGQADAKRVVAIAVRNRWRRQQLSPEQREEISPKNIMLIGPTGVGKTEIARRMASLVKAPFVKVEATKYTEVGYVGRNVDSMVRDLVENSISMVKSEELARVQKQAERNASERLVDLLMPKKIEGEDEAAVRSRIRTELNDGALEKKEVEITVEEKQVPFMQLFTEQGMEELGIDMSSMLGGGSSRRATKRMMVKDARRVIAHQEAEKLIDREKAVQEGVRRAQESGIIFIDEIDKIVSTGKSSSGPDISREGVQRDLLPIVEGATVQTRYGPVKTDHVLFIGAGAFSTTKPTDLIPELQGRFPLRAELKSLTRDDFVRILTEPKNAITKQYTLLLKTEGVDIDFGRDSIEEMATLTHQLNTQMQDIGARRLHTIIEKVLDEISYQAPDIAPCKINITATYVQDRLKDLLQSEDLKKYIL